MTKNSSRPVSILTSVILFTGLVQAQESTNASGGNATGSDGTVAYSIGQVVYTSNFDALGTVSQGVQQAYEIYTAGINETELNISLSVFPNPYSDNLILQVNDFELSILNFQLYDIQGELLIKGPLLAQQTQIITSSLSPATYFLKVVNQENKQIQTFKIIKN